MRISFIVAALLVTSPALAQPYYDNTRELNALRDAARAQERQAESLRRMEQLQYDRNLQADRAERNAARDARSARRFDHR